MVSGCQGIEDIKVASGEAGGLLTSWLIKICLVLYSPQPSRPWWVLCHEHRFGLIRINVERCCELRCWAISASYVHVLYLSWDILLILAWDSNPRRRRIFPILYLHDGLISTLLPILLLGLSDILERSTSLQCTCILLIKAALVSDLVSLGIAAGLTENGECLGGHPQVFKLIHAVKCHICTQVVLLLLMLLLMVGLLLFCIFCCFHLGCVLNLWLSYLYL